VWVCLVAHQQTEVSANAFNKVIDKHGHGLSFGNNGGEGSKKQPVHKQGHYQHNDDRMSNKKNSKPKG